MNTLDLLRDLVDDAWAMDFEEFKDILDFNAIAFQLVHEENQHLSINYVIQIQGEFFIIIEHTEYDRPLEIKQVKPHIITKIEYIEIS